MYQIKTNKKNQRHRSHLAPDHFREHHLSDWPEKPVREIEELGQPHYPLNQ